MVPTDQPKTSANYHTPTQVHLTIPFKTVAQKRCSQVGSTVASRSNWAMVL
jgi:hypothetical protein